MAQRRGKSDQNSQGSIWFLRLFALMWNGFLVLMFVSMFSKGTIPNWPILLFMIPFVAVGVFVIYLSFSPGVVLGISGNKSGVPMLESQTTGSGASAGQRELKPVSTPGKNLWGSLFICLFWNGIVSAFVVFIIRDWMQGKQEWGLMLFLSPFVLIGLVILYGVFHSFLSLFNPRSKLSLDTNMVRPGQTVTVRWKFQGNAEAMDNLKITLQGREEAVYTRGTSTYTDKNVFMTIPVIDTRSKSTIKNGHASVKIPEGTMPSFDAAHNRIIWSFHLHGEIPKWPDVQDEFPVSIFPVTPSDLKAIKDRDQDAMKMLAMKESDENKDDEDDEDLDDRNYFKRR
jgi:hypothetical protein